MNTVHKALLDGQWHGFIALNAAMSRIEELGLLAVGATPFGFRPAHVSAVSPRRPKQALTVPSYCRGRLMHVGEYGDHKIERTPASDEGRGRQAAPRRRRRVAPCAARRFRHEGELPSSCGRWQAAETGAAVNFARLPIEEADPAAADEPGPPCRAGGVPAARSSAPLPVARAGATKKAWKPTAGPRRWRAARRRAVAAGGDAWRRIAPRRRPDESITTSLRRAPRTRTRATPTCCRLLRASRRAPPPPPRGRRRAGTSSAAACTSAGLTGRKRRAHGVRGGRFRRRSDALALGVPGGAARSAKQRGERRRQKTRRRRHFVQAVERPHLQHASSAPGDIDVHVVDDARARRQGTGVEEGVGHDVDERLAGAGRPARARES